MVTWLRPDPSPAANFGYSWRAWDEPQFLARGQTDTHRRMPTAQLAAGSSAPPLPVGEHLDVELWTFEDPLTDRPIRGDQFLDRRLCNDALIVVHDGAVRHESFRNGLLPTDRHVLHSTTKTLTAMLVGQAVDDGTIELDQPVAHVLHELAGIPAWDGVTVQHLLDMTAGFDIEEDYADPASMYWDYAECAGYYGVDSAGGGGDVIDFVRERLTVRSEPPGTRFNYASCLSNLLPEIVSRATGRPAVELYEERLVSQLGLEHDALLNCDTAGHPIVEGQLNLTLGDFARWALALLDDGRDHAGRQLVPRWWVDETFTPHPSRRAAFELSPEAAVFHGAEYHNQAWLLDPAAECVAMLGIHGQFAYIDRPRRLLIAGFGSYPAETGELLSECKRRLWSAITTAVDS